MKYNFDQIIDRSNTNCTKLERLMPLFGRSDLLPLWVADMDFLSPPAITEALRKRTEHGVFGYTTPCAEYYKAITEWLAKRHAWSVSAEQLMFVPGVVKGFAFAIDTFTQEGDNVIIQPPVYPPFKTVTEQLKRNVVNNPLLIENGKFKMDLNGLKKIVAQKDCKMLIFCNPHNPGGRVWSPEELKELAEICYDNNVLVVSDEIHADLTLSGYKHTPFATVSDKAKNNSITLMAPSKTFNIAGLISSFAVIQNPDIRKRYLAYMEPRELTQGTLFAYQATRTAYEECEDWLEEVLIYIQKNVDFAVDFLSKEIPQIKPMIPEASFLIWLDCTALRLSQQELVDLFVNKANLALNDGVTFGLGGEGWMRLNIGSPRSIIEKALNNLKKAMKE